MKKNTIKAALLNLPEDGHIFQITDPCDANNSLYGNLKQMGYVRTVETPEDGILAVELTDSGKTEVYKIKLGSSLSSLICWGIVQLQESIIDFSSFFINMAPFELQLA
jgi:hypothetical protein